MSDPEPGASDPEGARRTRGRRTALIVITIVALTAIGFAFLRRQESQSISTVLDPAVLDSIPAMSLGSPNAPVTIAKFADFQCPGCAWSETNVIPQIKERLIDTGKARLLFFDFPIETHAHAELAARAARCAGEQGHFWEYHDALYSTQAEWSPLEDAREAFTNLASRTASEPTAFATCLGSRRFQAEIDRHVQLGYSLGVRGTPTFFVNSTKVEGGSAEEIEQLVDAALPVEAPAPD